MEINVIKTVGGVNWNKFMSVMKMNSKYCKPLPQVLGKMKNKGKWKERKLVVNAFQVSRMSGQVRNLGLKQWKLRARKLTLHLVNIAESNAQQN